MRLSNQVEGLISNYERLIAGFLAGFDYERLLPAMHEVNGMIDRPIKDIWL
jgi:glycine betaine catabolism A